MDALDLVAIGKLRALEARSAPGLLRKLVAAFEEKLDARLKALSEGVHDPAALEKNAHALRGEAGQLGARALEAACRELEENPASPDAATLVKRVLAEAQRARDALGAVT